MMIMCRDLTLDDVKDINVSMQCSAFDVLAAVAVRAKEILDEHLSAATETKVVKRAHDGEASTSASLPAAVAAWGKEIPIEEHLAMGTKRSKKRAHDGEASTSASLPPAVAAWGKEIPIEEHLAMGTKRSKKRTHDGEASASTSLPPAVAAWGKEIPIEEHLAMGTRKRSKKRTHDGEASASTSPPKKKKRSTKRKSNVVDLSLNIRPPLPERFDMLIREMAGEKNLTPPTLVIQKRLFETDLTKGHNRLSIPISLISDDFLTEAEKLHVRARDVNGKKKFMQAKMIEPSLATATVEVRQWDMVKGNGGKTSSLYVLNGKWYELALRNKLRVNMEVQLWCFRIDQELCFALVRPPMERLSF